MEGLLPIFNFSHTAILGWLSSFLETTVLPQLILKHLSLYIWRMVIDTNTEFKTHIHTHTQNYLKYLSFYGVYILIQSFMEVFGTWAITLHSQLPCDLGI